MRACRGPSAINGAVTIAEKYRRLFNILSPSVRLLLHDTGSSVYMKYSSRPGNRRALKIAKNSYEYLPRMPRRVRRANKLPAENDDGGARKQMRRASLGKREDDEEEITV